MAGTHTVVCAEHGVESVCGRRTPRPGLRYAKCSFGYEITCVLLLSFCASGLGYQTNSPERKYPAKARLDAANSARQPNQDIQK